jgi:hypothetical protein
VRRGIAIAALIFAVAFTVLGGGMASAAGRVVKPPVFRVGSTFALNVAGFVCYDVTIERHHSLNLTLTGIFATPGVYALTNHRTNVRLFPANSFATYAGTIVPGTQTYEGTFQGIKAYPATLGRGTCPA